IDSLPLLDEDEDEGEDMAEGEEDDELVEDLAAGRMAPAAEPAAKANTLKWIYAGIGGTVGLIVLVIVVNMLIPSPKPAVDDVAHQNPDPPIAPIEVEPTPP